MTTLKWVPGTEHMFLAAHFSGSMYLYNDELEPVSTSPIYQVLKQGEDYAVLTCKSKVPRNPVQRWVIGEGALHEFAFSNDTKYIATVSHDGFMRVFHYDSMEKYGSMKSYFGGLLCVCWSPDDKYIVVGGEDDLVTVWSFHEKRVVGRGRGHNSWVSVVSFDPFTTEVLPHNMDVYASDEDIAQDNRDRSFSSHSRTSVHSTGETAPRQCPTGLVQWGRTPNCAFGTSLRIRYSVSNPIGQELVLRSPSHHSAIMYHTTVRTRVHPRPVLMEHKPCPVALPHCPSRTNPRTKTRRTVYQGQPGSSF